MMISAQEKHCENLSKENDPKKFFQTFKKIADPILNTDPLPTSTRQIQDEWGNTAKTAQDKAVLFANRLQKIHQVPEFHGFNDGWKESVERYLSANKNSFVTNPISKYLEPEEGDDSTLLQTVTIKELRENLAKCKNKSAVGLDGISYKLIKRLPDKYLSQIAAILSSCVTLGYFPSAWRSAKTTQARKGHQGSKKLSTYFSTQLPGQITGTADCSTPLNAYGKQQPIFKVTKWVQSKTYDFRTAPSNFRTVSHII